MKQIADFEILDHGASHAQYFEGVGVAFTDFDEVVTGIGENAMDAYVDAQHILGQVGWDWRRLPAFPKDLSGPCRCTELGYEEHHRVSIRVR